MGRINGVRAVFTLIPFIFFSHRSATEKTQYNQDMDTQEELARRLVAGLEQLSARDAAATAAESAHSVADLTERLHQQLADLPEDSRRLIHTADSGFAATGAWVDAAIDAQTQQLKKLARATQMVAAWLGPNGAELERVFVIRGNIRGWAHRWRKQDKGTAQVDSDPGFVEFAADCLTEAGITGDHPAMIEKALGSDWRTAVNN
jgi:hypothetical protein